jgi:hypothetical protein
MMIILYLRAHRNTRRPVDRGRKPHSKEGSNATTRGIASGRDEKNPNFCNPSLFLSLAPPSVSRSLPVIVVRRRCLNPSIHIAVDWSSTRKPYYWSQVSTVENRGRIWTAICVVVLETLIWFFFNVDKEQRCLQCKFLCNFYWPGYLLTIRFGKMCKWACFSPLNFGFCLKEFRVLNWPTQYDPFMVETPNNARKCAQHLVFGEDIECQID